LATFYVGCCSWDSIHSERGRWSGVPLRSFWSRLSFGLRRPVPPSVVHGGGCLWTQGTAANISVRTTCPSTVSDALRPTWKIFRFWPAIGETTVADTGGRSTAHRTCARLTTFHRIHTSTGISSLAAAPLSVSRNSPLSIAVGYVVTLLPPEVMNHLSTFKSDRFDVIISKWRPSDVTSAGSYEPFYPEIIIMTLLRRDTTSAGSHEPFLDVQIGSGWHLSCSSRHYASIEEVGFFLIWRHNFKIAAKSSPHLPLPPEVMSRSSTFKLHLNDIWQECSSRKYASNEGVGFFIWRHNFNMATKSSRRHALPPEVTSRISTF